MLLWRVKLSITILMETKRQLVSPHSPLKESLSWHRLSKLHQVFLQAVPPEDRVSFLHLMFVSRSPRLRRVQLPRQLAQSFVIITLLLAHISSFQDPGVLSRQTWNGVCFIPTYSLGGERATRTSITRPQSSSHCWGSQLECLNRRQTGHLAVIFHFGTTRRFENVKLWLLSGDEWEVGWPVSMWYAWRTALFILLPCNFYSNYEIKWSIFRMYDAGHLFHSTMT